MRNVWTGVVISLSLLAFAGCSPSQLQALRDGVVSLGSCSLHTSLACTTQSVGACEIPQDSWEGDDWSRYADCIADNSKRCSSQGIARCAMNAAMRAAGGPVAAGGVGCSSPPLQAKIQACISDTTIETEEEAIEAVAACQRQVCLKGE
jgi:hypothetical protein